MFARMANIAIATWLLIAAFAFSPPTGMFILMLGAGLLTIGGEVLGMWKDELRFVATGLGALLILSAVFVNAGGDLVRWNNFFCGVAIVVLSMFSSRVRHGPWVEGTNHRRIQV